MIPTIRMKALFAEPPVYGMNVPPSDYAAVGVRLLRTSDFSPAGTLSDASPIFVPPELVGPEHLLQDGDFLVSRSGTVGRCILYQDAYGSCTHAGFLVRLRLRPEINRRFIWYVTQSAPFKRAIERDTIQSTIGNFNAQRMGELPIPLPSRSEQQVIVRFLDDHSARIQRLLERKSQLLKLVQQWNQARSIAALGDWREVPTRTLRQQRTSVLTGPFGTLMSATEYVIGEVPVINPTHIIDGELVPEERVSVSEEVAVRLTRFRLRVGDIVMGRKGDVGRAAMVPEHADGWICGSDSIAIRTDRRHLLPEFLVSLLHIDLYRQQLAANSSGATIANVNEKTLLSMKVPFKSVEQQHLGVDDVARAALTTKEVVMKLRRQVRLLAEERLALITAAVTGQIDVGSAA